MDTGSKSSAHGPADKKKDSPKAASKPGKADDKKDENFVEKAAHSIRDKVHGFTEDVKEKAHHLTHSDDSKKGKDSKKGDKKLKTSSHPAKAGKKDSSDSDDSDDKKDNDPSKPPSASKFSYSRIKFSYFFLYFYNSSGDKKNDSADQSKRLD